MLSYSKLRRLEHGPNSVHFVYGNLNNRTLRSQSRERQDFLSLETNGCHLWLPVTRGPKDLGAIPPRQRSGDGSPPAGSRCRTPLGSGAKPVETVYPQVFGPCLLWPNGWMDEDATWYRSRPRPMPHCVRRGPSFPLRMEHISPAFFSPYVYCGHDRPPQLLLSSW